MSLTAEHLQTAREVVGWAPSLRDAAALAALQGMLAHGVGFRPAETPDPHWHNVVAREAFEIAKRST